MSSTATVVSAEGLCQFCRGVSVETISKPGGHPHAPHLDVVRENAREGCTLCAWFMSLTWLSEMCDEPGEVDPPSRPGESPTSRFRIQPVGPGRKGMDHICLTDESVEHHTTGLEVFRLEEDLAPYGCQVPTFRAPTGTSSRETLRTALSWIEGCEAEHNCGKFPIPAPKHAAVLPRRLVDLRSFTTSSPTVRLVETSSLPRTIRKTPGFYSTLSYCWGTNPFHKTTTANLASSFAQIPHESLPLTFQDAFAITTQLGLPFIWIDALCIVQDSRHDWEVESAKMPYIYSLCKVCIAADASATARGGCFNDHRNLPSDASQHPRRKVAIPLLIPSVLESTGQVSRLYVFPRHYNQFNAQAPISDAPISTRAWCFQERFLSPRILHYTSEQLFWECRQNFKSEDAVVNARREPWNTMSGTEAQLRDAAPEQVVKMWCSSIVPAYSARKLTREEDRLPAIGGVARAYAHLLSRARLNVSDEGTSRTWLRRLILAKVTQRAAYDVESQVYIAGIWGSDIWLGLTWRKAKTKGEVRHNAVAARDSPRTERINTFSWVSAGGPVEYLKGPHWAVSLVGWHVPLLNPLDPFGGVGECELTLEGILVTGRLGYYLSDEMDASSGEWRFFVDIPPKGELGAVDFGKVDMDEETDELIQVRRSKDQKDQQVWALTVSSRTAEDGIYALVLSKTVRDDGKTRYRRLGLLSVVSLKRVQFAEKGPRHTHRGVICQGDCPLCSPAADSDQRQLGPAFWEDYFKGAVQKITLV